jgi:ATP-binding cassette subfamily B (MDR/TAP) protein 1
MIIGLILAVATGAAQPLMTLIFGRLTNSFTNYGIITQQIAQQGNTPAAAAALAAAQSSLKTDSGHNALYLLALGLGMFLTTWGYMFIWNYTGEVNAKRVREKYLRAVLRQEIAYFDDLGAGEVATRIQTDCHLVQEGTSEKVALCAQYLGTFFTGFILAFVRSPRLAGSLFSILPVIAITGTIMTKSMAKFSTATLESIARAGSLAEEVIGSIRTMQAFGNGRVLAKKFDDLIDTSRKAGQKSSFIEAGGIATMCELFFKVV